MIRLFPRRIRVTDALFRDHYIEPKVLYAMSFGKVPAISFIGELDVTTAFRFLRERVSNEYVNLLQHSYFDHAEGKMFFNNSIFVLRENRIIEVAANYCQILHTDRQYGWASDLVRELGQFRIEPPAVEPQTIIGFARQATFN